MSLFPMGWRVEIRDFLLMLMSMTYKQSLKDPWRKVATKYLCWELYTGTCFYKKKAVGLSHAIAKTIIGPEGCPTPLNKTLGAASWNKAL